MAGRSLGDIYTQSSFKGTSSGGLSIEDLDELFTKESGGSTSGISPWELNYQDINAFYYDGPSDVATDPNSPFITDESGNWTYSPDNTDIGKEDLYWKYDQKKEFDIENMYDRKMSSLSGTIDKMFRENKQNKLATSINIGRSNLMSGTHLDSLKSLSEDANMKLIKTKADINIDAIKTDMKVKNLRKEYESGILDVTDDIGATADIEAGSLGWIIDENVVSQYGLTTGNVGDVITINGIKYTYKNYNTVWKWRGKTRSYGWVQEGAGPDQGNNAGSDNWDSI
jgi:hypothetical protein